MVKDIALTRTPQGVDTFVFANGDFVISDSDQQHIQDIFESEPGFWKEHPLIGVAINTYLKSSGKEQEIQVNGAIQLKSDVYQDVTVDASYTSDGTLNIATNAVRN